MCLHAVLLTRGHQHSTLNVLVYALCCVGGPNGAGPGTSRGVAPVVLPESQLSMKSLVARCGTRECNFNDDRKGRSIVWFPLHGAIVVGTVPK